MEVLVSLAILGIVLSALYGAYFVNVETVSFGRRHAAFNQRTRILLHRISHDLESLFPNRGGIFPELPSFKGGHEEADGKPSDWMIFTTLSHLGTGGRSDALDVCRVLYHLVKNTEGDAFTLCRTEGWINNREFPLKGLTYELDRNIGSFEILYEDEKGREFKSWNTDENESRDSLPVIIRVRIGIRDETGSEIPVVSTIHPPISNFQQKGEK